MPVAVSGLACSILYDSTLRDFSHHVGFLEPHKIELPGSAQPGHFLTLHPSELQGSESPSLAFILSTSLLHGFL